MQGEGHTSALLETQASSIWGDLNIIVILLYTKLPWDFQTLHLSFS